MLCVHSECRGKIVSSAIEAVDEAVIAALRYRIKQFEKLKCKGVSGFMSEPNKKALLEAELEKAKRQLLRLYDLLEQEVYDKKTFLERSEIVNDKIKTLEAAIMEADSEQKPSQPIPDKAVKRLQYVIDNFEDSDAEEKNRLLHTAVRKIYYCKTERMCKNKPNSDLSLRADFL